MDNETLMNNYLFVLKGTTEVYVHGTLESSNPDIRQELKECLNQILSLQANTYDIMSEYGWYPVNNIDTNTILETLNKVKNS